MNELQDLTVQPLTASIGAVVGGVDLRAPLPSETIARLREALLDRGVLFLRDQDISVGQFWDFMGCFGIPRKDETTGTAEDRPDDVITGDISLGRQATCVWHADATYLEEPPIASALRMLEPPGAGGDTCWSSAQAAWEALSEPLREMLEGLTAVHSVQPTLDRLKDFAPVYAADHTPRHPPEFIHPVVTSHPETGRKALFVSQCSTTRIVELEPAESDALLSFLGHHMEKPEFCMRWHWSPNDIAFWDNRSVQHYAVDDYESSRVVQRIVLEGQRPSAASAEAGARH